MPVGLPRPAPIRLVQHRHDLGLGVTDDAFEGDEPIGQVLAIQFVEQHIRTHVPIIARGCHSESYVEPMATLSGAKISTAIDNQ